MRTIPRYLQFYQECEITSYRIADTTSPATSGAINFKRLIYLMDYSCIEHIIPIFYRDSIRIVPEKQRIAIRKFSYLRSIDF